MCSRRGGGTDIGMVLDEGQVIHLGCPNLIIVTDHCPLVKLLGNRDLKDIANPRLFRLKEKLYSSCSTSSITQVKRTVRPTPSYSV